MTFASTEAAAVGASETGIANHIIDWLLQARIDEKSYLADPAPNRAELIKSSLANIDEEALTLKKNSKDPASGELADLVIAQNAIYRAAFEKYVTGAAEQIAIRGRLADLAAEVDALSASSSASQRQQLHNESATAEILLLISAAVATGVSILLAGVMVWFIVKPLQRVIAAMRDVAEGEGEMEAVGVFVSTGEDVELELGLPGPGDYQAVDVSIEPDGGAPAHSGASLAGGKFGSAAA